MGTSIPSLKISDESSDGDPLTDDLVIADDWETTKPEFVADPPALEKVLERLDAFQSR